MITDLDFLFKPGSVALIGASPNPLKWGNWMSRSLIESGYKGDIYLVSTKRGVVYGKETYDSVIDIEKPVDVAIIGIPAKFVPDSVKDCVKKSVKTIIIVTAGFGETGEEGKKVEKELLEVARKGGARIVGPNCMGIYNAAIALNTSAFNLSPGFFAFLTQSGNFAMDVNYNVKQRGFGYSKWASFGNQLDIRFYEYLDYVKDDRDTRVILLYMEGLYKDSAKDGREFLRAAKEASKNKPIVAIKVGDSAAGIRAAASHTGSLAGSNRIYAAAFRQAGIIKVAGSSELLDVGEALAKCPPLKDNRIAILTDGGGHGTMGADAAEKYGLEIPVLSKETQEKLKGILPPQASTKNPVDFAGGAEADLWNFVRCSETLLQDSDVDGLLIVGQYGGYALDLAAEFTKLEEDVAVAIAELPGKYNKPIIMHTLFQPAKPKSLQILSDGGIPVYPVVETAIRCMGALREYASYREKLGDEKKEKPISLPADRASKVKEIIGKVKSSGRVNLVEPEAREILRGYGLPISDFTLANSEGKAVEAAERLGYPVAMKLVSPDIIHKSDAGGVKLNIGGKDKVVKAFTEIVANARAYNKAAEVYGVIVTPMEDEGIETIIGMTNDQTFGPTIMFGLGGIFVEVLKDVSFRVAPLTRRDAYDMVKEIKGFPILKGVRGRKPGDVDTLVDIILRVSALVTENPEIGELDLNPVFAFEKGASVVDARIILA